MMRIMVLTVATVLVSSAPSGVAGAPATDDARVSKLTEPQDDYPDISPDSRSILFQSNRSGTWQLWMMNRDGTGIGRVTDGPWNDRQPAWSPDGKRVAFSSDRGLRDGRRAIFLMDWPPAADQVAPVRLTDGSGQDVHPKWLPDRSGLVFNRISPDGRQADIHIIRLDGRASKLPLGPGLNTYASTDAGSKWLVFRGTHRDPGAEVDNSDIYRSTLDGSDRRRLTEDSAFDGWPAISPDGGTIAFASRRGGSHFRLYLMPIEGGEPVLVRTAVGYHYTQPAWSPDGRSLVVFRWTQDSAGEVGHLVSVDLPAALLAR